MTKEISLSRKLVLEARQSLPDGAGGYIVAWQPLGTLWADVRARQGREDFVAGRRLPRVKHRILIRAMPADAPSRPRPEQRFRDGTRVFDILTVAENDPHGRFLEIYAEEGVVT